MSNYLRMLDEYSFKCNDLEWFSYEIPKKYREDIGIQPRTEACIQSLVLKKTFESISFDTSLEEYKVQVEVASKIVEVTSEIVKADTPANQ